jgi:hypothetical protein
MPSNHAVAEALMTETRMLDRSLYTDDFVCVRSDGMELSLEQLLPVMNALVSAGPDFAFNVKNLQEQGDTVTGEAHVTATMTRDLSHPLFGDHAATGKKATLPPERFELSFRGGKVASMKVDTDLPAGPPEVVRQWTASS